MHSKFHEHPPTPSPRSLMRFFSFFLFASTSFKTNALLSSARWRAAQPHHLQRRLSVCAICWQSLAKFAGRPWCHSLAEPSEIRWDAMVHYSTARSQTLRSSCALATAAAAALEAAGSQKRRLHLPLVGAGFAALAVAARAARACARSIS